MSEKQVGSWFSAIGGRKLFLVAIAMVCITVIGVYKDVPPVEIIEYIFKVLAVGVAGVVVEDVGSKIAGRGGKSK